LKDDNSEHIISPPEVAEKMASIYGYDDAMEEEDDFADFDIYPESEEEEEEDNMDELRKEFDECCKAYTSFCRKLNWPMLYRDCGFSEPSFEFPWDLWSVDMYVVVNILFKTEEKNPGRFDHLLQMVVASRVSIGAMLASSFCEQINSAGNILMMSGNTLLGDE
jgi:hypothetical protein